MKKIILLLSALSLVLVSCDGTSKQNKSESHTHADGTVHSGNECESTPSSSAPKQESFKVDPSEAECEEDHDHHGHDHSHDHDHDHSGHKH